MHLCFFFPDVYLVLLVCHYWSLQLPGVVSSATTGRVEGQTLSICVCVCVCCNTHTRSDRLMIMLDQCQTNRRSEHFEKEYLALGLFQAALVFFTERSGLFSSPTSEKSLLFDLFL